MTKDNEMTDPLETFFDAERRQAANPSAALLARVLADADREQALHTAPTATGPVSDRRGVAALFGGLGGWVAAASLAAATVAGIWIGANPPPALVQSADMLLKRDSTYLIDLSPSDAFLGLEDAS